MRKSSYTPHAVYGGKHRFEHWYRDNQVYFITARCHDRYPAFASDAARAVFWNRFAYYTQQHRFVPIITTLLDNHYHTLGYLHDGNQLGPMMRKLHGSVAKLVNDVLPERRTPFWHDRRKRDYFDGCIRDEKQFRLAYRYTQTQAERARLPLPWAGTRVGVALDVALARAVEKRALLWGVPYKRYSTEPGRFSRSPGEPGR